MAKATRTVVEKINKSQMIRDYEAAHPGAKVAEVVAALKAQGVEVAQSQVYGMRSTARSNGSAKRRSIGTDMQALMAAKTLIVNCGGYAEAIDFLNSENVKQLLS